MLPKGTLLITVNLPRTGKVFLKNDILVCLVRKGSVITEEMIVILSLLEFRAETLARVCQGDVTNFEASLVFVPFLAHQKLRKLW